MSDGSQKLNAMVESLKQKGVSLPTHPILKAQEAANLHKIAATPGDLRDTIKQMSLPDRKGLEHLKKNNEIAREMAASRRNFKGRRMERFGSTGSFGNSFAEDVSVALPRFYDPMEFWDISGLPWNMADEGHRHKLHKWLRLYYATHYLVPILVDIFTRFPLVGMEVVCSADPEIARFYSEVFLDKLDYENFLVSLGREFWCLGESFALGSFNESLGIWENEELLNPENIVIKNFPMLNSSQMYIVPPDMLTKLAREKAPAREYKMLEMQFPELIPYLTKNEHIPVSGVLLKQVANRLTDWDDHGTPILLRGLRTLMHEEKLLASQDAIAERLYSPFILAKLGIKDLGDGQPPWIPMPEDLEVVRDEIDVALASDFRLMVHHFGIDIENVFGREQMPRLGDDFDRIERRLMLIFGINPSLLSAGAATQPYASSALQAEFLNQILRTYQGYLKKHFRERAAVVAEAQEHFAFEKKGQTKIPVYEEVVVFDEGGNERIETRPKLLLPSISFKTFDLRDEATERQFMQVLRAQGVPIPDDKLAVGIDFDLHEADAQYNEDLVKKTVATQEAKMKTYTILQKKGLPIPPDLKAEVEGVMQPTNIQQPPVAPGESMFGGPGGGQQQGAGGPPMGPGQGKPGGQTTIMPPIPPGLLGPGGMGNPMGQGGAPPRAPEGALGPGGGSTAPPSSMERRRGMPQASSVEKKAVWTEDKKNEEPSDEDDKIPPTEEKEKIPDKVIKELPKNKISEAKRKRYKLIDEEQRIPNEDKK